MVSPEFDKFLLQLTPYYLINDKTERRSNMPSTSTLRKAKLTVTISGDVVSEIVAESTKRTWDD